MIWNIDFAIAALIAEIVILFFYVTGGYLPLKRNKYFFRFLVGEIIVVILDIVSSIMHNNHQHYSTFMLYLITIAYFIAFGCAFALYYIYSVTISGMSNRARKITIHVGLIPMFIFMAIILATPFTGFIFTVSSDSGYHRGFGYETIYIAVFIMIVESIIVVSHNRYRITRMQYLGLITFGLITICGAALQILIYKNILITNAAISVALLILYLSLQNPDLLRDRKTGLYGGEAFIQFVDELDEQTNYSFYGLAIENLSVMKKVYGDRNVNNALRAVSRWLKTNFHSGNLYYINNGRFIIVDKKVRDTDEVRLKIESRFKSPWEDRSGYESIQFTEVLTYITNEVVNTSKSALTSIVIKSISDAVKKGSGTYVVINSKMEDEIQRDVIVEKALNRAISNNSIEVYFQPIFSVAEQRVTSAEALARLNDKEFGFISPDEFIKKAEENGRIIELGRQIFEKTCNLIKNNNFGDLGIDYVEVNLSPAQCLQENLANELVNISNKYKVPLYRINLEITETATVDQDMLYTQMNQLIDYGASFSLDDFGTGFSNIVNLLTLPLKIVKIDKSILWAYMEGKSDILTKVVEMFKNQNLEIVVEGVETREMAELLTNMGVDYMQGFYFSKALNVNDFCKYMMTNYPAKESVKIQRIK